MAAVKVKLNPQGIRELLTSREVERDLLERGRRIDAAAGGGHTVEATTGAKRVRVGIVANEPETMLREARDGSLSAALDAGR